MCPALATVLFASIGVCAGMAVSILPPRRTFLKVQAVKAGHPRAQHDQEIVLCPGLARV